jgi:hypothetical protein
LLSVFEKGNETLSSSETYKEGLAVGWLFKWILISQMSFVWFPDLSKELFKHLFQAVAD